METVEEKLITLLQAADEYAFDKCAEHGSCDECDKLNKGCVNEIKAHHLIQNGVTLQDAKSLNEFLVPIDEYQGLKQKYFVFKADSGERVMDCFVLRPQKDSAAAEALRTYANATDNKVLAGDIRSWIGEGEVLQDATDTNVGDKWISVDDRLPEESGDYLVIANSGSIFRYYYSHEELEFGEYVEIELDFVEKPDTVWISLDTITHWMPIPALPKGVQ